MMYFIKATSTNGKQMAKRLEISTITDHDGFIACLMVRVAVFVGEIGIPLDAAADPNDHCATHVLATVDGKPAGSMRLRFFNDVAVLERLAVLKDYRLRRYGSRGVAWELGEYAINFCRLKGYTKFYGSSRDGLVDFWTKIAPEGVEFYPIENVSQEYAGHASLPMQGRAAPIKNAVRGLDDINLLAVQEARLPHDLLAA